MKRKADDAYAPTPEQLAAYMDGELDPASRARVAAWLCAHPAAAAELHSLRQLESLWRETAPPAPPQATWDALLDRVVSAAGRRSPAEAFEAGEPIVASGRAVPRSRTGGWRWQLRMAGTAAALLLAALWLDRPSTPQATQPPAVVAVAPVLRVAGDDDVEIMSMEADDVGLLVVGEPPMRGPFILVAMGDIVLENLAPDPQDGMMPITPGMNPTTPNNINGPMILAPLGVASNR
jgi:anti-sigma factor RsiW